MKKIFTTSFILIFAIFATLLLISSYAIAEQAKQEQTEQKTGCIEGNCRDGQGIFVFSDGAKYTGEYKNGQPHGIGIHEFANGSKYSGEWELGMMHGEGTFSNADGKIWAGQWTYNIPINAPEWVQEEF